MAINFGAKFIETSVGIQHNIDELLVGVLKQIRLHEEQFEKMEKKEQKKKGKKGSKKIKGGLPKTPEVSSSTTINKSPLASPLYTLQVARDILTKVCINAKQSSISKSCENLHVL